jgi:hypothetical protein
VPVNNPTNITPPQVQGGEDQVPLQQEDEIRFGFDFNTLVDTPSIDDESELDDPVTTGGDNSNYSSGGLPGNPGGPTL